MILKELYYDNNGVARATVISNGKEYCCAIDKHYKVSWCSCASWVFNKTPCKHILYAFEHVDWSKMIMKKLDSVDTDSKILNNVLDDGIPYGTITGIFGEPKVGKSWFAYQAGLANIKYKKKKTLYIDTEGTREKDIMRILGYISPRFDLEEKDIKENFVMKTTLASNSFTSVQELFRMFGMNPIIEQSTNGKFTIKKFEVCKPTIKEEELKETSMIIIDSVSSPIKDAVQQNTANLPARAILIEKLFNLLHKVALRHSIAIITNSHASVNPVTPFGRDYGKSWGGDSLRYNVKFVIEFIDAPKAVKTATGWGEETRRIKLIRSPFQTMEDLVPIRLKNNYGYCDE